MVYRYAPETRTLEVLGAALGSPLAMGTLWTGETVLCGMRSPMAVCTGALPGAVKFTERAVFSTDQPGGTIVFPPNGEVLFQAIRPETTGLFARRATVPEGAVRPTLSNAPSSVRIGETVTLPGTRFMRPCAVGTEKLPTYPGIMPLVFFMPAAGGGPIYARVTRWEDTSLDFIVPSTPYHGPGWLHVTVEGVPSKGAATVLEPRSTGQSCTYNLECESGYCTEGVCCEASCEAGCESCLAAWTQKQDGVCAPIPAGHDPKDGCEVDDLRQCGRTGVCDGARHCEKVQAGTPCDDGKLCRSDACTVTLGEPCGSSLDCAPGQVCGVDRACWRPLTDPDATDVGACSVFGTRTARWGWLAVLAVAGLPCVRRRR
jgi:hypothetical protein